MTSEARWGGALLGLGGGLTFICIVVLSVFYASPEVLGAQSGDELGEIAAAMSDQWGLLGPVWGAELLGAICMAVGGLLLQRHGAGSSRLPASVGWSVVAIGGMVLVPSYGITLGAYPGALAAFGDEPVVFAATRAAVVALFQVGSTLLMLGSAAALVSEALPPDRAVPRPLVFVGLGLAVLAGIAAAAGLAPGAIVGAVWMLTIAAAGVAIALGWASRSRPTPPEAAPPY